MLPQLRSEESLRAADVAAVGGGTLTRSSLSSILRRWRRESSGDAGVVRVKPSAGALGALGIGYREVTKTPQ